MKTALITGITGQDGSYLTPLLLSKGYQVHGIKRYSSNINTPRINEFMANPNFHLHHGDLTDQNSLMEVIKKVQPTEVYNLGALSHVKVSFSQVETVHNINAGGPRRILHALHFLGMDKTRFYQASTSEMFGGMPHLAPQNEDTPFHPRSPYGISKLSGHWSTINYREAYGMYACNGILFNHESPVRGETFVTRKITRGLAAMLHGKQNCIYVGNLDAKRDWGHAADYVQAMYLMLQQAQPADYVIATGNTVTIRDMIRMCFEIAGFNIRFKGKGEKEVAVIDDGFDAAKYEEIVGHSPGHALMNLASPVIKIDPQYYRPSEVDLLVGDSTKARTELGWEPKYTLQQMLKEMIQHDYNSLK